MKELLAKSLLTVLSFSLCSFSKIEGDVKVPEVIGVECSSSNFTNNPSGVHFEINDDLYFVPFNRFNFYYSEKNVNRELSYNEIYAVCLVPNKEYKSAILNLNVLSIKFEMLDDNVKFYMFLNIPNEKELYKIYSTLSLDKFREFNLFIHEETEESLKSAQLQEAMPASFLRTFNDYSKIDETIDVPSPNGIGDFELLPGGITETVPDAGSKPLHENYTGLDSDEEFDKYVSRLDDNYELPLDWADLHEKIIYNEKIIELIPQKFFTTNNTTFNCGREWGYYIQTTFLENKRDGYECYLSKVILFDIEHVIPGYAERDYSIFKLRIIPKVCYQYETDLRGSSSYNQWRVDFDPNASVVTFPYSKMDQFLYIGNSRLSVGIENVDQLNQSDINYNWKEDTGDIISHSHYNYEGVGRYLDHESTPFLDTVLFLVGFIDHPLVDILSTADYLYSMYQASKENWDEREVIIANNEANCEDLGESVQEQHEVYGKLIRAISASPGELSDENGSYPVLFGCINNYVELKAYFDTFNSLGETARMNLISSFTFDVFDFTFGEGYQNRATITGTIDFGNYQVRRKELTVGETINMSLQTGKKNLYTFNVDQPSKYEFTVYNSASCSLIIKDKNGNLIGDCQETGVTRSIVLDLPIGKYTVECEYYPLTPRNLNATLSVKEV